MRQRDSDFIDALIFDSISIELFPVASILVPSGQHRPPDGTEIQRLAAGVPTMQITATSHPEKRTAKCPPPLATRPLDDGDRSGQAAAQFDAGNGASHGFAPGTRMIDAPVPPAVAQVQARVASVPGSTAVDGPSSSVEPGYAA